MSDDLFVLKEDADSGALKDGVSYLGGPDISPSTAVAVLLARARLELTAKLLNTVGLQSATAPLALKKTLDFAHGTDEDEADQLFSAQYVLGSGASVAIDVVDSLTDAQKNQVCALLGLPNGCEAWSR